MIRVVAQVTPSDDEKTTRYEFDLFADGGESYRHLIVDLPNEDDGTTDVWVSDSTVEVGDTPADGFATFTPNA